MSKTFKEFAEACWDSHKQVGTKISSRTGKRVPNCVPKNEDNLEEKKVRITKNGKELLVWDAELRTYQQMGWTVSNERLKWSLDQRTWSCRYETTSTKKGICRQDNGKVWSGRQDGYTCIKG